MGGWVRRSEQNYEREEEIAEEELEAVVLPLGEVE